MKNGFSVEVLNDQHCGSKKGETNTFHLIYRKSWSLVDWNWCNRFLKQGKTINGERGTVVIWTPPPLESSKTELHWQLTLHKLNKLVMKVFFTNTIHQTFYPQISSNIWTAFSRRKPSTQQQAKLPSNRLSLEIHTFFMGKRVGNVIEIILINKTQRWGLTVASRKLTKLV